MLNPRHREVKAGIKKAFRRLPISVPIPIPIAISSILCPRLAIRLPLVPLGVGVGIEIESLVMAMIILMPSAYANSPLTTIGDFGVKPQFIYFE